MGVHFCIPQGPRVIPGINVDGCLSWPVGQTAWILFSVYVVRTGKQCLGVVEKFIMFLNLLEEVYIILHTLPKVYKTVSDFVRLVNTGWFCPVQSQVKDSYEILLC